MPRISKYRIKNLLKNFILLCVIVILFLGIGELTARFLNVEKLEYDIFFMEKNPNLANELIPNAEGYFKGHYTKINKDGFRDDKNYDLEKDSIFRIVSLGGSITFGEGVDLNDTYSKQLEFFLKDYCKNKDFEVLNMGVSGYNIVYELEFLKERGLKYNPDLIIVNLFSRPNKKFYYFPFKNFLKKYSYLFSYLHKKYQIVNRKILLERIEAEKENGIVMDAIGRKQNEDALIGLTKIDKDVLFMYFPTLEKEQDFVDPDLDFYEKQIKFLRENKKMILDLRGNFEKINMEEVWVSEKNHHPNKEGHEIAARGLFNYIKRLDVCK